MENKDKSWQRMRGEPALWYERFDIFRQLGPGRTLEDAWRKLEVKTAKHPSWRWYEVAKEWNWVERAAAWDAYRFEQLRQEELEDERAAKAAARENRRALISGFAGSMATALTSYTESINRLERLVGQLQRMMDNEREPAAKAELMNKVTALTKTIANLSSLSDVTSAMEMVTKQMRTEYGDFLGTENKVELVGLESGESAPANIVVVLPDNGRGDR
jgi:hypothetical protein